MLGGVFGAGEGGAASAVTVSGEGEGGWKVAEVTKPRKESIWRRERALWRVSRGRMPGMVIGTGGSGKMRN